MIKQYDFLFKIVIIGDSSVGKSSLLRRFSDDQFQESYLATIGVDFRFKSLRIQGNEVKLQIWDTAGQERFRTITSAYYKGAQGIIIVYDVNSQTSYKNVEDFWIGELDKYAEQNVLVSIIGNKSDCEQKIDSAHIEDFCKTKNILHSKVSAKTGMGVAEAFKDLSERLTAIHPKVQKKETPTSKVVANVMKKKQQFKLQTGAVSKNEA